MTSTQFETVTQLALKLSESDRHWLAERLWWSRRPGAELDSEWDAALARRTRHAKPNADRGKHGERDSAAGGYETGRGQREASNESTEQPPLDAVTVAALRLARTEREALALRLWASIDDPSEVAAAWDAEIERRVKEMEAGTVEWVSSEEVFERLHARMKDAGTS